MQDSSWYGFSSMSAQTSNVAGLLVIEASKLFRRLLKEPWGYGFLSHMPLSASRKHQIQN